MRNAKDSDFAALIAEAQACRRCPAMSDRTAVLSQANGSPAARIMFVGEAPGRTGGDRTRVPFSGDASGRNFQRFIDSINLPRRAIFISNSVLCNPRKPSGANRKPSRAESVNCSHFLRRQIEILAPRVIVTRGSVALEALRAVEYHQFSLRETAGTICEWNGRLLVPLYHPSPQVLASHRREAQQLQDYRAVAEAIERIQ